MSKRVSKNKKLILGSALAGLIVSGPGLSLTATPTTGSGAKYFRTAPLSVGYREARAADEAPAAAKDSKKEEKADTKVEKKADDKHCCQDSKCGPDKQCGKDKHSAPKAAGDKSCGAGACGGKDMKEKSK